MDWMDELLEDLPSERPSPDLVSRVQARLAARRARERWMQRALRAGSLAAAGAGAALIWPRVAPISAILPTSPLEGTGAWLSVLMQSPLEAWALAVQRVWAWGQAFGAGLEAGLLLALIFFAAAGSYGTVHLLTLPPATRSGSHPGLRRRAAS